LTTSLSPALPTDAEQLHRDGAARLALGDLRAAGHAFRCALALSPGSDAAHADLCDLLARMEAWSQLAIRAERRLCAHSDPVARSQLALALLRDDAYEEASIVLRKAIAEAPSELVPWMLLAEGEERGQRSEAARTLYERGVMLSSGHAGVPQMLVAFLARAMEPGAACRRLLAITEKAPGHSATPVLLEQAAQFAVQANTGALAILAMKRREIVAPGHGSAHGLISETLRDDDPDRALLLAQRFVALAPWAAEAYGTLAMASRTAQKFAGIEAQWRRALAIAPDYLPAFVNLPQLLLLDMRTGEALRWARRAVTLRPPIPAVLWNLGQVLVTSGFADPGVAYEENRLFDAPNSTTMRNRIARPRWNGDPLGDRSLMIWLERGLGDQLYYARWLAMIRPERGKVFVECDQRVVGLYQRSFPHLRIVAVRPTAEETVEGHPVDLQVPIGSLPLVFIRETEEIFAAARRGEWRPFPPYLRADPARIESWKTELAARPGRLRVGISWRSGLLAGSRNLFYLTAGRMVSMLRDLPLTVVNLQYSATDAELDELRSGLGDLYLPPIDLRDDLDDLSALLAGCDVVIAPGTAILSHAAALGRPSWYCSFGRDWMYPGLARHPLLPSVEYFSRGLGDDWDATARRVRAALIGCVEGRRQISAPA
jgi:tetratricopeptide (TPR) repeat protein